MLPEASAVTLHKPVPSTVIEAFVLATQPVPETWTYCPGLDVVGVTVMVGPEATASVAVATTIPRDPTASADTTATERKSDPLAPAPRRNHVGIPNLRSDICPPFPGRRAAIASTQAIHDLVLRSSKG